MGKKLIVVLSFIIAAIGFGGMMYFRKTALHIPLWDEIAMTYGGVFVVFWVFDTLGKMVSRTLGRNSGPAQSADSSEHPFPRPQPGRTPRQQAVVPNSLQGVATPWSAQESDPGAQGEGGVRLQRVSPSEADVLQRYLDVFLHETYALSERVPVLAEDGHVAELRAQDLLQQPGTYSFLIVRENSAGDERARLAETTASHENALGAVVATLAEQRVQLSVLFVPSKFRLKGVGSRALRAVFEFFRLLEPRCHVEVSVPGVNHRAQKFLRKNGFVNQGNHSAEVSSEGVSLQQHIPPAGAGGYELDSSMLVFTLLEPL